MTDEITEPLIILAGGQAKRLGEPKGLMLVSKRPWLEEQVERFAAAGGKRAILVLGYHEDKYRKGLPWLAGSVDFSGVRVTTVINKMPEHGPYSSLKAGLRRCLAEGVERAFVLPVDVPCPQAKVFQQLDDACEGEVRAAVPVYRKRGGHPVLLQGAFIKMLVMIPDSSHEARLDVQIEQLKREWRVRVEVDDPCVRLNINTQKNLKEARKTLGLD